MADNLGPMAWLFLPENEQVQYLQKIAQMRKKYIRPHAVSIWTCFIFRTKCDFLLPLRQLIFRIVRRAIEAHRLQSIFTLSITRI